MIKNTDYSTVTELPGRLAHQRQLSAIHTRYHYAAQHCQDQRVLEVACGAGFGLPYLAKTASQVVGGDIDENNIPFAEEATRDCPNARVQLLDGESLPFDDQSFDTIVLCEAIYYFQNVDQFFQEAKRVLADQGKLIIVSVNSLWHGFNPSPFSSQYLNHQELSAKYTEHGFTPRIHAGFKTDQKSVFKKSIGWVRSLAVKMNLIPKTMRGKEWLKRLFYGKLREIDLSIPSEDAPLEPLFPVDQVQEDIAQYEVLYACGTKK